MEVVADICGWDELFPDALALIFTKLSLRERLTVIPMVCKSWASAVNGPYCWQEIEITDWTSIYEHRKNERMVQMLIARSSGSLRKLSISGLKTRKSFPFIAKNAGSLRDLRLPSKQLEVFCWNMHPTYTWGKPLEDAKAFAIASTMSKLKRLEMVYHLITNEGVLKIISSCPKLECLDLRGCWGVKLDTISVTQNFPKLMVLRPQVLGN